MAAMFASFIVEYQYPTLENFGAFLELWLRKAGFGALGLLFIWALWFVLKAALRDGKWVPYGITGRLDAEGSRDNWRARSFWYLLLLTVAGLICLVAAISIQAAKSGAVPLDLFESDKRTGPRNWMDWLINGFCLISLVTLSWEFLLDVFRFSPRRLIAIARFSIKEAIRRKVLWSFLLLGLVVLFASWFISTEKKDDQWRQYVNLVFYVISVMVLLMSSILACFSLPTDIKQQTIFTVVTKPVLKLEIILGRVLGLVFLMTMVLLVAGGVSVIYVARGVDPEVAQLAKRARQVRFGSLYFIDYNERGEMVRMDRGYNVGREWEYFQYIRGGSAQEAIWYFRDLPADLANRDKIAIEGTFDIFRTSKGGTDTFDQGVSVQFWFVNPTKWRGNFDEYREARDPNTGQPLTASEKARKFGYYELPKPIKVLDEGIASRVTFPASLLADSPQGTTVEVHVNCRSSSQYLGTAQRNLYLIVDEANWAVNYFKGLTSIWFYMIIVVCIGVVLSTYLNAPVSLLLSTILILGGQPKVLEYIHELSLPSDPVERPGGGPFESAVRTFEKVNLVAPISDSAISRVAQFADNYAFRFLFKAVYAILPDLALYDRTIFVAEGFDIDGTELVAAFLRLLLFVFPFLLVGYYLLNGREIAN
jgi:ABC-type transport system involved in multi-copper enzyme maturation permease subunit